VRDIELVSVAGLLHDIGKFGQRAEIELKKDSYKSYDYRYNHARYTAQILYELSFNLGDELNDSASMHHNPKDDLNWIIASADRMASGFEREAFNEYNAKFDKENFKKQRLWHLFDKDKRFAIDTLNPNSIYPVAKNEDSVNEYEKLWKSFINDLKKIKTKATSSIDRFTIDYLLKKYTSFIPSSTTFKIKDYTPVKANIPLYDHLRATAIFSSVIYKLYENGNENIINYYKRKSSDIEQKDMLLINGDFFGIQNFIFDGVPTAKASKILRAKSAYIQILTKIIAFYIVDELELSYNSIISTNAGKFEILGVNDKDSRDKLHKIQEELNDFFIKEYFGQTGIGISFVETNLADFIVAGRYENLRERLANEVEKTKFNKFDLISREPVLSYDEGITNQNLCEYCNKRKQEEEKEEDGCKSCNLFINIGEKLAKSNFFSISKGSEQDKIFGEYSIDFFDKVGKIDNVIALYDISNNEEFKGYAKWELSSYVAKNEKNEVKTFEELAKKSVKEGKKDGKREHGVEALMAMKGDVDSMGRFINNPKNEVTNSFARYNFFARMIDYFFSVKASVMMKDRALYTVFAGGDDIFILGAWDEVIEFTKELREEFKKFVEGSELTLSVGMVMTKPNKPVNFVAFKAEEALEKSKEHNENGKLKDAISLFGESVKWDDYLDDNGLMDELKILDDNTSFLYRLLELVNMSKKVKYHNHIPSTIWKSKLNYSFCRNIDIKNEKNRQFLSNLNIMIEKYPQETKMFLSEFIYKRRLS